MINIGYNLQGLKDVIVFPKIKYQQQRKREQKLEYVLSSFCTITPSFLFVSISVHNYVIVKLVPEFTCFSVEQNQQKRWGGGGGGENSRRGRDIKDVRDA